MLEILIWYTVINLILSFLLTFYLWHKNEDLVGAIFFASLPFVNIFILAQFLIVMVWRFIRGKPLLP